VKPAVFDANILIDLLQSELLSEFLELEYENYAPPDVIEEVHEADRNMLVAAVNSNRITVPSIEDLTPIAALKHKHPALSFQDCACLYLAKDLAAIILTGERPLRNIARGTYGLEVHGTLFILDELVQSGQLTPHQACDKLVQLMASGTYLPKTECQKRLRIWKR